MCSECESLRVALASALARAADADHWREQSEAGWHTAELYAEERNEERTRAEQAERALETTTAALDRLIPIANRAEQAEARVQGLEAYVKELEWSGYEYWCDGSEDDACPACRGNRDEGHRAECKLAAALAAAPGDGAAPREGAAK